MKQKNGHTRRLVVKFGTANLCDSSGHLSRQIFDDFSWQIAQVMSTGTEVIVVSSGAIQAGREIFERRKKDYSCLHKKDLAGVGARHLMNMWGESFGINDEEVGQVWVTFSNWKNGGERRSIRSTVAGYLKSKAVVPIINELDVVSDREIRTMDRGFSENDKLAGMVAELMEADAILFLTDIGGIFNRDPGGHSDAKLYQEISARKHPRSIGISTNTSKAGTGGMLAKWKVASRCARKGMMVAVAGNQENVILRFTRGESVGTRIGTTTRLEAK